MKMYSVRGVTETLYVDGTMYGDDDWFVECDLVENDDEAQLFSVYKVQEGGGEIWVADFGSREDAELFVKIKQEVDNGNNQ